jgi:hypothetical protein
MHDGLGFRAGKTFDRFAKVGQIRKEKRRLWLGGRDDVH